MRFDCLDHCSNILYSTKRAKRKEFGYKIEDDTFTIEDSFGDPVTYKKA